MWRKPALPVEGYSLRRRLFVRLFGALALLAAGLFAFIWSYAGRAADRAYDQLLLASALSIADTVRVQNGRYSVDLPYSSLSILAMARRDRIFYRITAPDGAAITGYDDLPIKAKAGTATTARYENAVYRGVPVRVAVLDRLVTQPQAAGWVTIAVAQTREERNALARDILTNAFLPIALAILVGAMLIWFGVRQSLQPLQTLEQIIRERQPHNFSPVAKPPPAEVSQLVGAINQLMARLKANLETMQTFLADAAHQIRTPLASLRSQAELAAEEEDPEELRSIVHRIHRNAVDASQLTSQLLNHAMVIHRSEALEPEDVDLAALLTQVTQRAAAIADDTPIRLEIEGPAIVAGDPISLREALTNLVDNAVKYGDHAVDVRLSGLRVEIADRGPGIPDTEKETVLQRFGRGRSAAGVVGSGLGLAIVKAVAEAHGGTLTLHDRPGGGLIARFDLPTGNKGRRRFPILPALGLLLLFFGAPDAAAEPMTHYAAPTAETERLRLHGATDLQTMDPLIRDFQQIHPTVAIDYVEMSTAELYQDMINANDGAKPDLLISSAVDLQVKLVNDGHAQPYVSEATLALPEWANWRNEAFGLTFEPAVIAYNRKLVPPADVPQSRDDLIRLLRGQIEQYRRHVATYDIGQSGIGYLFATQDSVLFSHFWPLVAALGHAQARLACCTGDILDMIEQGEVLIAYNVLGSYAQARASGGAPIGIVQPRDYTLIMSRVAVIPRLASNPQLAGRFIDYLLSDRGRKVMETRSSLESVSAAHSPDDAAGPLIPITLNPALLVFLDGLKRDQFLQQWQLAFQAP
jgi:two-component system sensor histidine kinase TctE